LATQKKRPSATSSPASGATQAENSASAQTPHVIKKYPNRRLYDTASSSYITLAQVKRLVIEGKDFSVRDAKSGEDLTRSILLQIILEEEMGGVPMFSEAALAHMIRFYGHTMQGYMGSMMEKNMQALTELQEKMSTHAIPSLGSPAHASQLLGQFMEQSQAMAAQMQEKILAAWTVSR